MNSNNDKEEEESGRRRSILLEEPLELELIARRVVEVDGGHARDMGIEGIPITAR